MCHLVILHVCLNESELQKFEFLPWVVGFISRPWVFMPLATLEWKHET